MKRGEEGEGVLMNILNEKGGGRGGGWGV